MTARDPSDLRDARVDTAWRAMSREEPPAAIDDAIRAAARREIGAGPRSASVNGATAPNSLRPQRAWWPLAAAATIGAIAIGLLQLTEPERVGVAGEDKAVVSDTPASIASTKKQEVAVPRAPVAPVVEQPAAKPAIPAPAATRPPPPNAARERIAPAPRPGAPGTLRKDAPAPLARDEGAAALDAAKPSAGEPRQAANAAAAAPPLAEPFPGDTSKRESKEATMRDAATAAPTPPAPPAAAVVESPASGVAQGKIETAPPRQVQRANAQAGSTAPSELAARRSQEAEDARGIAAAAAPKTLAASVPRAKAVAQLSVPDWIALIRKLRDEGRRDDAAKELAAFRSAHADHEQLLPPDLRYWKPVER